MGEARCSSCLAVIHWVRTASGARMPIDEKATPDGRVVFQARGVVRVLGHVEAADPSPTITTRGYLSQRYTSHFATCPHAARHRKRRTLEPDYGESPLASNTGGAALDAIARRVKPREGGR